MGKNKRNKGKSKASGANSNGGVLTFEDSNVSTLEQNQLKQCSGDTESQQTGVSESDVDLDKPVDDKQSIVLEAEAKELLLNGKCELEEKVKCLQEDVYQCHKKEAWLEARLEQLQSEINTWMLKEVHLSKRIKALENDKDSWTLKQSSTDEMMQKLEGTNAELQTKVIELGQCRDHLSQENQLLMSNISLLELRVQKLEEIIAMGLSTNRSTEILPEDKDAIRKTKSSSELIVRSVQESHEVNRSYEEPIERSFTSDNNLVVEFESSKEPVGDVAHSGVPALYSAPNVLETISIDDSLNEGSVIMLPASADQVGSQEIVPCQLDEIEIQEVDSQPAVYNEKEETVPLTDAPLIGAPFRLISFVAKYVSGADLVKENARASRT